MLSRSTWCKVAILAPTRTHAHMHTHAHTCLWPSGVHHSLGVSLVKLRGFRAEPMPSSDSVLARRKLARKQPDPLLRCRALEQSHTALDHGLERESYLMLMVFGAPRILFPILKLLTSSRAAPMARTMEMCEFFCGVAQISENFSRAGYNSTGIDVLRDPLNMDLCTPRGFLYAMCLVLATKDRGFLWFATVCSSWVWMCRGTSERSRGDIYGRPGSRSCYEGNMQAARSALLMLLGASRRIWWTLEQPASSLMECPSEQSVRAKCPA